MVFIGIKLNKVTHRIKYRSYIKKSLYTYFLNYKNHRDYTL